MLERALALFPCLVAGCGSLRGAPLDLDAGLAIEETFDAKTDTREWRVQQRYVEGGPRRRSRDVPSFNVDVVAFELGPGHAAAPGQTGFLFRLHSIDDEWRFLSRERDIELYLDGTERLQLGEGDYLEGGEITAFEAGPYGNGYYRSRRESLVAPLWRAELGRIAHAGTVEVQAGPYRFRLHPATIEAIGRLLATVPERVK